MKPLLLLVSCIVVTLAATPAAEARGKRAARVAIYVEGRTSCGCPVRVRREVAGHDRCGHPVYREAWLPVRHRCRPPVRVVPARPAAPCLTTPGYHRGPVFVPAPSVPSRRR